MSASAAGVGAEARDEHRGASDAAGADPAAGPPTGGPADQGEILAFGVPSLDELFGYPSHRSGDPEAFGIGLRSRRESTSLCIIGPDGTGKSVLALHLAAQYVVTAGEQDAPGAAGPARNDLRVLYVSTDLSYAKAETIWDAFVLGNPTARLNGLEEILAPGRARAKKPREAPSLRIQLDRYTPLVRRGEAHSTGVAEKPRPDGEPPLPLTEYLCEPPYHACSLQKPSCPPACKALDPCKDDTRGVCHRIAFIDMESATAGDDWGLINRLLATMEAPDPARPRNLLIIDAVEGLETLGGERDAFGQERNRRSRIAQILRAAKGKCHVVFIVEEPKENERLPEEFVSDAVLRLRVEPQRDYARRSVEIEKLRGQAYVRGRHDCRIRRGSGSQTGDQENPDSRAFRLPDEVIDRSYFQVIHSLQYLSREVMERPLHPLDGAPSPGDVGAPSPDSRTRIVLKQPEGLCGFGIRYLDGMIGSQGRKPEVLPPFGDPEGLPWGQITALIGDEGTHKSRLGRAFLSQALQGAILDENSPAESSGVALLLTIQPIDAEQLARLFFKHHDSEIPGVEEQVKALQDGFKELTAGLAPTDADRSAFDWVPAAIETIQRVTAAIHKDQSKLPQEFVDEFTRIERTYAPHRRLGEIVAGLQDGSKRLGEADRFQPRHRLKKKRVLEMTSVRLREAVDQVKAAITPLVSLSLLYTEFKKFRVAARRDVPPDGPDGAELGRPVAGGAAGHPAAKALRNVTQPPPGSGPVAERLVERFGDMPALIGALIERAGQLRRLNKVLDRTVCRRLEIHHMTAANLFHVVHSLVEEGMHILYADKPQPPGPWIKDAEEAPGRIRLVIDDWSGITNLYPEVRDDPLFMPFLTFYLKRRGVTTLVIDTQPGRLNHILSHETDRELRALVPFHLYSWHVTFYGEKRVALAALPPISDGKRVVVRELKPFNGQSEQLIVDPHFEFYSGFDDDRTPPRAIPLQVRLYHEDEGGTVYHDDVRAVFDRLFGPSEAPAGSEVVRIEDSGSYEMLRDFAYLQGGAALEHTLVLQVDEYWSQEGGSLSDLGPYLNATVSEPDGRPAPIEDPFRLFRRTEQDKDVETAGWKVPGSEWKRHEKFRTFGYHLVPDDPPAAGADLPPVAGEHPAGLPAAGGPAPDLKLVAPPPDKFEPLVDRVPYTVDFGLLLADRGFWAPAFKGEEIRVGRPGAERTVKEVWDNLRVRSRQEGRPAGRPGLISWRQFFDACLRVADLYRSKVAGSEPGGVLTFDVDLLTMETVSSLLMEIWASELYALGGEAARLFPARRDVKAGPGLLELTRPDYLDGRSRRALFAAWLLLEEVLTADQLGGDGFQFQRRQGAPHAVACRHWYSTASLVAARHPHRQLTPLRLPGHYSTRGDWFLAVAAGSRSNRLGERAVDLLTSRRANVLRMQHGLGLPARGWGDEDRDGNWIDAEFRSPFRNHDGGGHRHFRLHDLWSLGGGPAPVGNRPEEFYNLWRSRLRAYDQHSRIFAKWIKYIHEEEAASWPAAPRFERYDHFDVGAGVAPVNNPAASDRVARLYQNFGSRCDELHQALLRSTPAPFGKT